MTPSVDDVIELPKALVEEGMKLTRAQRQEFARLLLEVQDDPEVVRKEWNSEIKRRIEGYLNGSIPTLDAGEMLDRLERDYAEKYSQ